MSKLIGVYGTLKKGQRAAPLMGDSTIVNEGYFEIPYKMYNTGSFPMITKDSKNNRIYLEIHKVSSDETLSALDRYEGYPSLFDKEEVEIEGNPVTVYVGGRSLVGNKEMYNHIKDGKY